MCASSVRTRSIEPDTVVTDRTTPRSREMRLMAANLLAMARQLEDEQLAASEPLMFREARIAPRGIADKAALLERIGLAYANRRQRQRFFPSELFGEPAWDLLLDLFKARLESKMITVTSACIAADVPLSTALRWIGVLEQQGLVERQRNVSDHRSTWVRLTDSAAAAMIRYTEGCIARARRVDRLAEEHLIAGLDELPA